MKPASQAALMPPLNQADLCCLPTDGPAHSTSRKAGANGVIRIGVAREVFPLLRAFGVDPGEVIRHAGLDPELFDDENNVIPYAALGRVLTACVARTVRTSAFSSGSGERSRRSARSEASCNTRRPSARPCQSLSDICICMTAAALPRWRSMGMW